MYLFLDFDGILHTHSGKRFSLVEHFLKTMKKHPDVKIVFSTSWREYTPVENLKAFLPAELHKQCVGKTPWIKENIKHIRYEEIQQYLKENKITEPWLAVDDLAVLFPPSCENLFLINGKEGLNKENAKLLNQRIRLVKVKITEKR